MTTRAPLAPLNVAIIAPTPTRRKPGRRRLRRCGGLFSHISTRARGLDAEGHELFVQRSVSREGRGRARVSGQLVPVGVLSELFQGWIEISSQHDSQSLLRPETQGFLLDASGKLLERRAEVERGYRNLRELSDALRLHRERAAERERLRDFLAHQVAEIDEARIELRADARTRRRREGQQQPGDPQREAPHQRRSSRWRMNQH